MPKLRIPERSIPIIVKILELDERRFKGLIEAISEENHLEMSEGGLSMPAGLHEILGEDAADVVDVIGSLYGVRSANEVPLDEFVGDVCDALEASVAGGKLLSEKSRAELSDRLKNLLTIESLVLEYKARDLQTEDEHTFCDARILTDLRPVFGSSVSERPHGVVMIHLLKLGYHDTGDDEHRSFYLSLDAEDLTSLRKVIERAEAKAQTLRKWLERAGTRHLGI